MPGKPSRPFGPVQTPVTVKTLRAVLAPPVHSPSTCQPAAPSVKKLLSFFTACRTSVVFVVTTHHGINYGSVYFPNSRSCLLNVVYVLLLLLFVKMLLVLQCLA